MHSEARNNNTILRRKQVQARTGLSRSALYLKIKTHDFPSQISLGDRAVGWLEHEVDQWLVDRIAVSRTPSPTQGPVVEPRRKSVPTEAGRG